MSILLLPLLGALPGLLIWALGKWLIRISRRRPLTDVAESCVLPASEMTPFAEPVLAPASKAPPSSLKSGSALDPTVGYGLLINLPRPPTGLYN